jgi:tRNA A-37 threonylcarbamoyl transferase component Bud32
VARDADRALVAAALGADLAELVRRRRIPLVAHAAIGTSPSPVRLTQTYRLDFADGATWKGQCLASQRRAFLVARLLEAAGNEFPPVIARRHAAIVVPWVEGPSLAALHPLPSGLLERCGRLLGRLHLRGIPAWRTLRIRGPADLLAQLLKDLALLTDTRHLAGEDSHRAADLAGRHVPSEASAGIIHNDFCPENIVVDASGTPVPIDNATLTFGPHDFDLARWWHRWAMTRAEREDWLRGYRAYRQTDGFYAHFPFWTICALAGAAANRARAGIGGQRTPLDRLRALLQAPAAAGAATWDEGA